MTTKLIYHSGLITLLFLFNISQTVFSQTINFYSILELYTGDTPLWVTVGDINGDGKPDIVAVNAGNNGNTISVFLNTTPNGIFTPSFSDKTDFNTGINPVSVAIGDLNGDGKPDIVVANGNSNTVSVLFNTTTNGASTPSFSAKTDFNTGNRPVSVAIGDINGDGSPDIIVANYYSSTISVLLNSTPVNATTASFSAKTDFATGINPSEVALADLNGDGKLDVVTSNPGANTMSVFLNTTSDGASTPSFSVKNDFTTGATPTSLAVADVNGDGKPDIIISNFSAKTVSVFLNTTTNGASAPVFSAKKDFMTSANPHTVTAGDLNGDGKPDIALANYYTNSVSVLLNTTSNGASSASFSSEINFTTGNTPVSVSIAPFNGEPDIVTANSGNNTVSVLFSNRQNSLQYLEPFLKADTIYDETIQPIKPDTGLAEANLLFKAKKIIYVKDAFLKKEFVEGSDWIYENGKIKLPLGSSAPYFTKDSLVFNVARTNWSLPGKVPGTYVLYKEGYFQSKQLAVTYQPEDNRIWQGPVSVFADNLLVHTITKLQNKDTLKVVYYGDSITKGANVSGFQGVPPFMPLWTDLLSYNLASHYQAPVNSINLAVGGTFSQWGVDNVSQVIAQNPDLTVIGFGMNDGGTAAVAPEVFKKNIKAIIDSIRHNNPNAEFILISTMLANPNSIVDQIQELYKPLLDSLTSQGIVVADITGVHKELLKHKSYQDMTGNNVNHPNDYLARWYAQFISGLLIQDSTTSVKNENNSAPAKFSLSQNYPNPFNPTTKIEYIVPTSGLVNLKVFNLLGQVVVTLVNKEQKAGSYTVNYDASGLASGVYLYRIQAGSFALTKKMILLK